MTMAFVSDEGLFQESFASYREFLRENSGAVMDNTASDKMVKEVGEELREAAEKWLTSLGYADYLDHYEWEYHVVRTNEVNAWCMPGGKIVVYSGILPITKNRAGLATVMGHELAHALLNHSRQRESAEILKVLGAVGVAIVTKDSSAEAKDRADVLYSVGSTLLGTLPFSRQHEIDADELGLTLMTIAGYDPDEAAAFWERMSANSDGMNLEFLSTHPADERRIVRIKAKTPEAKETAAKLTLPASP
jgi:predicted Zn-dependent protease